MSAVDDVTSIEATVRAFLPGEGRSQVVTVDAGEVTVATWTLSDGESQRTFDVPAESFEGRWLPLTFRVAQPTSPRQRGLGPDDRLLGVGLTQLASSTLPFAARHTPVPGTR